MFLDEIILRQKQGLAQGIPSICSAHPRVLSEALRVSLAVGSCLIEATCNQVNQFGGYTGMTPADFVPFVRAIADRARFPFENVILGGDHLGPSVWQREPAESAMQKACALVQACVEAGFVKIHLDCSMRLGDDPSGPLRPEDSARRAARLARIAETSRNPENPAPRYVIGSEVPVPGGAQAPEAGVSLTRAEDVAQTIEITRREFRREGLESAWDRVAAIVVQPGVEFGDDLVVPYKPEQAFTLSRFIEGQPMVYEAHSTDYQTRQALTDMVRDHFAILKVGPALTFAFREAIFSLAMIEDALLSAEARSNVVRVLDETMRQRPEYWQPYYRGSEEDQAAKRRSSLSDRVRYYWPDPRVHAALQTLMKNLSGRPLPPALLKQFVAKPYERIREGEVGTTPEDIVSDRIREVLLDYTTACGWQAPTPFPQGPR